jgi:hypothetical protein
MIKATPVTRSCFNWGTWDPSFSIDMIGYIAEGYIHFVEMKNDVATDKTATDKTATDKTATDNSNR